MLPKCGCGHVSSLGQWTASKVISVTFRLMLSFSLSWHPRRPYAVMAKPQASSSVNHCLMEVNFAEDCLMCNRCGTNKK